MVVFIISAVLLIMLSVAALLWPLLRAATPDSADRKAVNLAIAKQRLRELGRERENGTLSEEAHKQATYELELTLAGDLDDAEDRETTPGARWMAALVLVLVPVSAGWLYFKLGSPVFLDGPPAAAQNVERTQMPPGGIDELVAKLEQRMQEVPDDPEGQRLLIRTYMSQGRFDDAVTALNSWGARDSRNPDLLVMLADATASRDGGQLFGEPEAMLTEALEIAPDHMQALWIMGYTQAQKNNPESAIGYWERLLPLVDEDPDAKKQVVNIITEARVRAGMEPAAPAAEQSAGPVVASPGLQVEVVLDPALADKVSPEHAVFVYAKTPSGPPMPLAVVKHRVADLPLRVTLDDSTAMIATHKLSGQSSVTVGARVSLGGGPVAQPGDFYIELDDVQIDGADIVKLAISKTK
ncbi:MAG: c-type cytochrome biogenesis protein CcmI [Granulosicoccaceae bacterium]